MLYLMNFREDSSEMNYFVVDFLMMLQAWIEWVENYGIFNLKQVKQQVLKELAEN